MRDRVLLRCRLFRSIPNPVTRAVFLYAALSDRRAVCEVIDDGVPAILARDIFEGLGLEGRLRKHEQVSLRGC